MIYAYIFLIFAMANECLYLIPDVHVARVFNVSDLGIALVGMGLVYYLVFSNKDLRRLGNFAILFVILYLFLVLTQVSVASFKYSQSIMDGLIVSRRQFYYLAFPLFLFMLDDIEKINKMMSILTAVAIALVVLSIINYSGMTLFYHRLAEGQGIRAGITRAFVPVLELLVMTAIWQFSKYLEENKMFSRSLLLFFILYGGILFRQTRGHILATFAAIVLMLFFRRRFKILAGLGIFVLVVIGVMSFTMEQNLILYLFTSTYEDLTGEGGEGTWEARVWQFDQSLKVFLDNFWTGSGGVVIRGNDQGWSGWGNLFHVAMNTDLGYWVWLKFYGFPGILLMGFLIWGFFRKVLSSTAVGEARRIVNFSAYHFVCILISMVTLNYFTADGNIVILCLLFAILINADQPQAQHFEAPVDRLPELKPVG